MATPGATVYIHGVGDLPQLSLELLYENTDRSGGGDIQNIDFRRDQDLAVITFTDSQVAERVVLRSQVSIDGRTLEAKPPPELDTYSVLVEGIPAGTSHDILSLLFDSKKHTGGEGVKKVYYRESSTMACVTFKDESVASRVLSKREVKLGSDHMMTLKPCPVTDKIQVHDAASLGKTLLELYFSNTGRSGGKKVVTCEITDGTAIIQFENHQVAKAVLSRKHVLDKRELQVEPFFTEIGLQQNNTGSSNPSSSSASSPNQSMEQPASTTDTVQQGFPLENASLELLKLSKQVNYLEHRVPGLEIRIENGEVVFCGSPSKVERGISLLYDVFCDTIVNLKIDSKKKKVPTATLR